MSQTALDGGAITAVSELFIKLMHKVQDIEKSSTMVEVGRRLSEILDAGQILLGGIVMLEELYQHEDNVGPEIARLTEEYWGRRGFSVPDNS